MVRIFNVLAIFIYIQNTLSSFQLVGSYRRSKRVAAQETMTGYLLGLSVWSHPSREDR